MAQIRLYDLSRPNLYRANKKMFVGISLCKVIPAEGIKAEYDKSTMRYIDSRAVDKYADKLVLFLQ